MSKRKAIFSLVLLILTMARAFSQCYPIYGKMPKQPILGIKMNEGYRIPYSFYYFVSAVDKMTFEIWDGNKWSVLKLPASTKFIEGRELMLHKCNDVIIGYGAISAMNNIKLPRGKYIGFIQFKNGVWDTMPGGLVDSSDFYFDNVRSTAHNLYYIVWKDAWHNTNTIYKYDTSLQKFSHFLEYDQGWFGTDITGGNNRLLLSNIKNINGKATKGFAYVDGDSIKLNNDNRFNDSMDYGLDMYNDHIYALNFENDPTVYEFDNKFIQVRKTKLDISNSNYAHGNSQAYNGKLIWVTYNASFDAYHNVLCTNENNWKQVTTDVTRDFGNVKVTKSGIYALNWKSGDNFELFSGSRITGVAYIDLDSNCKRDTLKEPVLKQKLITATSNFSISSGITNDSGRYEFYIYPDTIEITGPGPKSSCALKKDIMLTGGVSYIKDIPFRRPNTYDLKIKLLNSSRVRWNSNVTYEAEVENVGLPYDSAHFEFMLDPKLKLVSGDSQVTYLNGKTASGQLKNLGYFDKRIVKVMAWVDTGSTKIDSSVCNGFSAYLYKAEKDSSNNKDYFCQRVVYSLDPNHKDCGSEKILEGATSRLEYFIGFQNEGNDDAEDVVITDTLATYVSIETLEMIGASHPYTIALNGRVLSFTFRNINLKPKKENEQLSEGFIKFSISTVAGLKTGDSIINRAFIYFDLNQPVITNTSVVIVEKEMASAITEISYKNSLLAYPNPTQGVLHIRTSNTNEIQIYSVTGGLQFIGKTENGMLDLDMAAWPVGLYLIRNGNMSSKIIKME